MKKQCLKKSKKTKKKWRRRQTKWTQEFCNTPIDHDEDIKMDSPNFGFCFKLIYGDDLVFVEKGGGVGGVAVGNEQSQQYSCGNRSCSKLSCDCIKPPLPSVRIDFNWA